MHTLTGFELLDEASRDRLCTTYRATRRADRLPVFIKFTWMDVHGPEGLASLCREYKVLGRLRDLPVVQALGIEPCEGGRALILERRSQTESLAACFQRRGALGLDICLRIGIQIAEVLTCVHAQGYVHNFLNLDSVFVSEDNRLVRLSEFAQACAGPYREVSSNKNCQNNYFLAPERLPKSQRQVDGRSDLYAVGCILYNLLAGRPPFADRTGASLMYAQRVLAPVPLYSVRPGLMPCVAEIVHTLLLKDKGARLASAGVLAQALTACRERYNQEVHGLHSATRQAPRQHSGNVEEPLVGRDTQVAQIISSFRRCRSMRSMEVVVVKGAGGTGKTRLIHEVPQTVGSGAATVVSHRCRPTGSARPWSALAPLLDQLIETNIESFPELRDKLAECNRRLFARFEPCLRGLPQPQTIMSPESVAQEILRLVEDLLSVCSKARMCVLVLDDVHNADAASLTLLGQLYRLGPRVRVTLVMSCLAGVGQERRLSTAFSTRPATWVDVAAIPKETWKTVGMAQLLDGRSATILPLRARFMAGSHARRFGGQVEPDDPLELLAARGARLSSELKLRIRMMAECEYTILDETKMEVLCSLLGCEPAGLVQALRVAVELGMAERGAMAQQGQAVVWQPCVQRWLGSGLKKRYRRRLHRLLAWESFQQASARPNAWIDAAVHLMRAGKKLHDEMNNLDATRAFLHAAILSLRGGAVEEALTFLRHGMQHMPGDIWERDEDLTKKLYQHVIEVESRYGDARRAKACSDRFADEAHEPGRRLLALRLRVMVETRARRYRAAYSSAVAACHEFGVELPTHRGSRRALKRALRGERAFVYPQLLGQARPSNRMDELIRLVAESVQPALAVNHWLGLEVLLVVRRLICSHGTNETVHLACAGHVVATVALHGLSRECIKHATMVWGSLGGEPEGTRVLARALLLKWVFCWDSSRTRESRGFSPGHVHELCESLPLRGEQLATDLFVGRLSVTEVEEKLVGLAQSRHWQIDGYLRILACLCKCFHGEPDALAELTKRPQPVPEDALANEVEIARFRCLCGTLLHYLAGNEPEAARFVGQLRKLSQRILPAQLDMDTAFISAMALAGSLQDSDGLTSVRRGFCFWQYHRELKSYHQVAPEQVMGRMHLLEAQTDRFRGEYARAWARCMAAIDRALSEGQLLVAAIGYELAATVVADQGLATLVPSLLRSAWDCYQQCGFQALVQPLVESAVGMESGVVEEAPRSEVPGAGTELTKVIELSREISRELRFERLLHRLVTVLLSAVGGQRCLVLLHQDDCWQVVAEGMDAGSIVITPTLPVAEHNAIPMEFIASVIDSRERFVLHDATVIPDPDPDFLVREVRAVLCVPILHQGHLRGIVYLEDCRHPGVYTDERVQLLGQLTAQISSSIENARLFHELDMVRDAALLAERAKTRFLLNLSHELRTPLNAVIGYSELIEEEIEDGDIESVSDDLQNIYIATERLQRTLSSIYALSRLESGRVDTQLEELNVHQLLWEIGTKYRPRIEARGLEVDWQLEVVDQPFVTDTDMLEYCVTSLVDNARRFTNRGRVRLFASMRVEQGCPWLRVEVSDTGIGITQAQQSTLFDPFHQVDDSTTRTHEGAGVSLAVTRQYCRLLGGRLLLKSERGVGSTFTLEIPTQLGERSSAKDPQVLRRPG